MRYTPKPIDSRALCEPIAASLAGWLVHLIVWFCEVLDTIPAEARDWPLVREFIAVSKARIALDLRRGVFDLGQILLVHAHARMNYASKRLRQPRSPRALMDRGAARRTSSARRRMTRVLAGMNAGSLRARAERLAAALDNLEPLIARTLKHVRAMWRCLRAPALILAPAKVAPLAFANAPAPALTDTS